MSTRVAFRAAPMALALAGCTGHSQGMLTQDWNAGCSPAAGGLCALAPPGDPGPQGVIVDASGEALALTGYAFPPTTDGAPAFVDGWEVHFTRLLATIDDVTFSNQPDLSLGDEAVTGSVAVQVRGPWAVDLAHADPSYLPGKGGAGEEAVPIASVPGNSPLAADGTRYAFGFDVIAATTQTSDGRRTANVNLDADGLADYQTMVADGCTVLYVGTATFKGGTVSGFESCNAGHEDWPTTVNFRFCFKSPTTYVNCQNPDNTGTPLPNEEAQRGIALSTSEAVIAQITVHTDHPFWDSVLHDSPPHFDQFAARVVGVDAGAAPPTTTLDLTKGVDYSAYTDSLGRPIDWRYCITPPTDVHPQLKGPMAFDPQGVPPCSNGDRATGFCDYYDFTTYDQSTQGHLNSDGLCATVRHYPSFP